LSGVVIEAVPAGLIDVAVDLAAIRTAHERIRPHIRRTPVLTSPALDAAVGAKLFFKCENLQQIGAFKARGACNAVRSLSESDAARGVVTHSSGNHGAALELLEDVPDLDAIVTPVGGGGLLSGTAIAAKGLNPTIRIFGAEPAGADDAFHSLLSGHIVPQTNPRTIADGLRSSLGEKTFVVLARMVDGIGTTSEEAIVRAMRLMWEKVKLVVEPSSAVPLAAMLENKLPTAGMRVGIIISGGNVDLNRLPWQS